MSTDGCSVHMPHMFVNFKFWGAKQYSSHIWCRLYLPTFLLSVGAFCFW